MKKAMVYGTFHGLDETIILQSSWLFHGISLTGFSSFWKTHCFLGMEKCFFYGILMVIFSWGNSFHGHEEALKGTKNFDHYFLMVFQLHFNALIAKTPLCH